MEISPEPSAPPLPPRSNARRRSSQLGRSLRRGGVAIGRAVGDFFGVTEESQHGNVDNIGWGQVAQIRAEDAGFLTLRRNTLRSVSDVPPDYNALELGGIGQHIPYQSFDPDEISSDSDSEDETVFVEAPPDYYSLPPSVNGQASTGDNSNRAISMYGHDDPTGNNRLPNLVQIPDAERTPPTGRSQRTGDDDFIYDPDTAFQYYMNYIRAEQRVRQRRQVENAEEFFGEGQGRHSSDEPRGRVSSISQTHTRGRVSSVGEAVIWQTRKKKGRKLERQNTLVRQKVESLPTFWPIFIVGVTFVQLVVVVVLIVLNNLAPINIAPNVNTEAFPSLYNETGNSSVTYYRFTNLWIGMSVIDLIHSGVKFTPCMRRDRAIIDRNLIQRANEIDGGGLGCCQNNIWVGTTVLSNCVESHSPGNNTDFKSTPCEDTNALLANFHPCCISITGQCLVMHIRECNSRGGIYHAELDSCNETNCLNDICGLNGVGTVNGDPLQPSGNQGYRLVLSLFIHLGVIHVVIISVVQLYVGYKIERTAGFLRVALIYLIAGTGGNLVSAIFIPYQVNGGASPAVFGLIGVLFVELFQAWQIVDRAWLELFKLTAVMIALLLIGTLPFIDNLANIGGLIFGIPAAIVFLPYITFGKVDAWRKRILLIVCVPILIVMYLVSFLLFYFVRDPDFCSFCHYFNCIPYTSSLCNNEINNPNPAIFAL